MIKTRIATVIIATGLTVAGSANADLFVYEPFDYSFTESGDPLTPDNNIVGDAATATGLTGNWANNGSGTATTTVQNGSITLGTYPTANNHVLLEATQNNGGIHAALSDNTFLAPTKSTTDETKTFWASFLFQTPDAGFEGALGIYASGRQQQPLAMVYASGGGTGMLQTANTTSTGGDSGIASDTPKLFLMRVDVRNDASEVYTVSSYVWQFDAAGIPVSEPTLGTAQQSLLDASVIGDNRVPISGTGMGGTAFLGLQGHNTRDMFFDEIRLGETFADVVIPEPASLALLGLGGLMLARRQRQH